MYVRVFIYGIRRAIQSSGMIELLIIVALRDLMNPITDHASAIKEALLALCLTARNYTLSVTCKM